MKEVGIFKNTIRNARISSHFWKHKHCRTFHARTFGSGKDNVYGKQALYHAGEDRYTVEIRPAHEGLAHWCGSLCTWQTEEPELGEEYELWNLMKTTPLPPLKPFTGCFYCSVWSRWEVMGWKCLKGCRGRALLVELHRSSQRSFWTALPVPRKAIGKKWLSLLCSALVMENLFTQCLTRWMTHCFLLCVMGPIGLMYPLGYHRVHSGWQHGSLLKREMLTINWPDRSTAVN